LINLTAISRYCWIRAGRVSAKDSRGQFEMQRRGEARR
jgi:hypothetical protein